MGYLTSEDFVARVMVLRKSLMELASDMEQLIFDVLAETERA